tara:strand:+ start:815 stop:1090 length:276 start_codon:yes stop_codon:yes gene_type:complete
MEKLCSGAPNENFKTKDEAVGVCTMAFVYYFIGLTSPSTPLEKHLFPCFEFDMENLASEFVIFMDKNKEYEMVPIVKVLPRFFKLSKDCDT